MSDPNASYDLAVGFVSSQIVQVAYGDRRFATVGDMRDCDCTPLTVHLPGGERWDFLSAATGDSGRLWATYVRET